MPGDGLSHDSVWTTKSDKIMDGKMGSIRELKNDIGDLSK